MAEFVGMSFPSGYDFPGTAPIANSLTDMSNPNLLYGSPHIPQHHQLQFPTDYPHQIPDYPQSGILPQHQQQQSITNSYPLPFDIGASGIIPPSTTANIPPEVLQQQHFQFEYTLRQKEAEYYNNLFKLVDPNATGCLPADVAASFLQKSCLSREWLHEIWSLSDVENKGFLTLQTFCVACRLVAHCQNSIPPSADVIAIEPMSLPDFDTSRSPSIGPFASINANAQLGSVGGGDGNLPLSQGAGTPPFGSVALGSLMDPTAAAAPYYDLNNLFTSTPVYSAPGASMQIECNAVGDESKFSGAVTESDLKKYSLIFQRTDKDNDGLIEGREAFELFNRSKLPNSELSHIWQLSDSNSDGNLNFNKFIVAMHLVTLRRRGFDLPHKLPPHLESILTSNVPISKYLSSTAPPTDHMAGHPTPSPTRFGWGAAEDTQSATDTPTLPLSDNLTALSFGGFTGDNEFPSPFTSQPLTTVKGERDNSSRRRRSSKQNVAEVQDLTTFGDKVRDAAKASSSSRQRVASEWNLSDSVDPQEGDRDSSTPPTDVPSTATTSNRKAAAARRGKGRHSDGGREDRGEEEESNEEWLDRAKDTPCGFAEALIESDKALKKRIALRVSAEADTAEQLVSETGAMREELVNERKQLKRQLKRKEDFEQQTTMLRAELERLKDERRTVDLQKISVGRDLSHYQDEALFLKQQVAELQRDIEMLQESNATLTRSCEQSDEDVKQLDSGRKNVKLTLKAETEMLQKEEREVAELRTKEQRMRREKESLQSQAAILHEHLRQGEQDRRMQFTALESERSKLNATRQQRLEMADHRLQLTRDLTGLSQQSWLQQLSGSAGPAASTFPDLRDATKRSDLFCSGPAAYHSTSAVGTVTSPQHPMRDAKGVPAGAPSLSAIVTQQSHGAQKSLFASLGTHLVDNRQHLQCGIDSMDTSSMASGTSALPSQRSRGVPLTIALRQSKPTTSSQPTHWAQFGSQGRNRNLPGSTAVGVNRQPTCDSKLNVHRPLHQHATDKFAFQTGSIGYRYADEEFQRENEPTHIGSREEDNLFCLSTGSADYTAPHVSTDTHSSTTRRGNAAAMKSKNNLTSSGADYEAHSQAVGKREKKENKQSSVASSRSGRRGKKELPDAFNEDVWPGGMDTAGHTEDGLSGSGDNKSSRVTERSSRRSKTGRGGSPPTGKGYSEDKEPHAFLFDSPSFGTQSFPES